MTTKDEDACCIAPSEEETRQRLARELMYQSAELLKSKQPREAETLLCASYVLLDESGGRTSTTGAWLMQMSANIRESNGQLTDAIEFSRKAKETAKTLFGRNDAFTCAFNLIYAIRLAQAGFTRGLAMVDMGIKRLENASTNPEAPSTWLEQVLAEGRQAIMFEQKPQDPKNACEIFAKLYKSESNGVYLVELKSKGNRRRSARIEVKVHSASAIDCIAEEHRKRFKGIKVKISIEPIAGAVFLHKAS